LSFTDSPFFPSILEGKGTTFLETFEDDLVNTPGLTVSGGVLAGAGGIADAGSVDQDDGAIDGSGTFGHSWWAITEPSPLVFRFDMNVLGSYPTHAGLVWTDGKGLFRFEAFDPAGVSLGSISTNLGDATISGTTAALAGSNHDK